MEIDVTAFVRGENPADYSASRAERGPDAGPETWAAAVARAAVPPPMLASPEALQAMRQWCRDTGAWSRAEIARYSDEELNALFIQLVSGDMREGDIGPDTTARQWKRYERDAAAGQVSGRLYRSGASIFFYLGS